MYTRHVNVTMFALSETSSGFTLRVPVCNGFDACITMFA